MLSELVAAKIPPASLASPPVFFSTQQGLLPMDGISELLWLPSSWCLWVVAGVVASTGALLSHVLRQSLPMKQKKEQKSSGEPSVYYFHPVSSLLNVSFSSRAEVIHVFCVSVMQSVMLRLIAMQSGLLFFILFYIIVLKHVDYMRWMLGLEVSQACSWKVPSS